MTGFRSGKSGGLISEAKTAGRAIGKRRRRGKKKASLDPPAVFGVPPPSSSFSIFPSKFKSTTPRRITAQNTKPPLNAEPVRPLSAPVDLTKYRRPCKPVGPQQVKHRKWFLPNSLPA